MMYNLVTAILIFGEVVALAALAWLAGAFVAQTFDVWQWTPAGRGIAAWVLFLALAFAGGVTIAVRFDLRGGKS